MIEMILLLRSHLTIGSAYYLPISVDVQVSVAVITIALLYHPNKNMMG
jgi:hypothetical protein